MAATEDLAARVERIERILEERAMERSLPPGADRRDPDLWDRVSFGAWLKISGPTFAAMVLGFGALWNSQQATTQRILDLERSTTDRILAVQSEILELQRSTTERLLEMQRQILELQRETQRG